MPLYLVPWVPWNIDFMIPASFVGIALKERDWLNLSWNHCDYSIAGFCGFVVFFIRSSLSQSFINLILLVLQGTVKQTVINTACCFSLSCSSFCFVCNHILPAAVRRRGCHSADLYPIKVGKWHSKQQKDRNWHLKTPQISFESCLIKNTSRRPLCPLWSH